MNYGQFLNMVPEACLVVILIIVFFADLLCPKCGKDKVRTISIMSAILLLVPLAASALAVPTPAFGGLYVTSQMANVMKVILTAGTIIVAIMARPWLDNEGSKTVGEFYELILSTLLGMYIMISSGNFLMFFLGLETASVPMACLVALDKKKKQSAEAAAKYILTATFSSGVMLYGISLIYAAAGNFTSYRTHCSEAPTSPVERTALPRRLWILAPSHRESPSYWAFSHIAPSLARSPSLSHESSHPA